MRRLSGLALSLALLGGGGLPSTAAAAPAPAGIAQQSEGGRSSINDPTPEPGQVVVVAVAGGEFPPGAQLDVILEGCGGESPRRLGFAYAAASGGTVYSYRVPQDAAAGCYRVRFLSGVFSVAQPFRVVRSSVSLNGSAAARLPDTGRPLAPVAVTGTGLVLLGFAGLLSGRRRRPPARHLRQGQLQVH